MKPRSKRFKVALIALTGSAVVAFALVALSYHDVQSSLASGSQPTLSSVTPDLTHVLVLRWRVGEPDFHENLYWTLIPFRKVYVTK